MTRRFPIISRSGGESIEWALIAPHGEQAKRNHCGQTLERLAERGGLSWNEAFAVIRNKDVTHFEENHARARVRHLEADMYIRQTSSTSETEQIVEQPGTSERVAYATTMGVVPSSTYIGVNAVITDQARAQFADAHTVCTACGRTLMVSSTGPGGYGRHIGIRIADNREGHNHDICLCIECSMRAATIDRVWLLEAVFGHCLDEQLKNALICRNEVDNA